MAPPRGARLLIVGNPEIFHIGGHLQRAARELGLDVRLCDVRNAFDANRWLARLSWRWRDRAPVHLNAFSDQVCAICREFAPVWLLTTGIAPLTASALGRIQSLGVKRLNYLTDDPWNPAHRASWFLTALAGYDHVFSPRRANLEELRAAGCPNATFLPFAYAPDVHHPEALAPNEGERLACDVVFVGGADDDRVSAIRALVDAGFDVNLYGGYWKRSGPLGAAARGHADVETTRKATIAARVALCLVRRANRDGNVMRSFEIPAIGACMLAEDTREHREIYGAEGDAVLYFHNSSDMVAKVGWLLRHEHERKRLATAAHRLITTGRHRYRDRLATMLDGDEDAWRSAVSADR